MSICEGPFTFAVGHLALGYLTGKATSNLLNVKINVAMLFLASMLPDIDLILGLEHRGPAHSLIIYAIMFVPAFWLYGKQSVPFFISLAQHPLLGDLLTGGGVQVLWPAVSDWYGTQLSVRSTLNLSLEWTFFLMAMVLLWKTKDVMSLFKQHPTNLLLTVPALSVILPLFLSFPFSVPVSLIIPHLVFLTLLVLPIITDLKQIVKH